MTCRGCNEQVCTCPDLIYSGLAEPCAGRVVGSVSRSETRDMIPTSAGGVSQLPLAPGTFAAPVPQPPASAVPPCSAHPLTGEVPPCLAGDLVDQGARDRDAHGARGVVKGAAVHIHSATPKEARHHV